MNALTARARAARAAGALTGAAVLALSAGTSAAAASTDVLAFEPDADTYVDASAPQSSFARSQGMWVDADPQRVSHLKFWTPGLAGRPVTGARLVLRQQDASATGGRVRLTTATEWPEAMTWSGRPALDGPLQATFGAVAAGTSYTAALDPAAVRDGGLLALGLDSPSRDGARWATSESGTPPRLEVEVASTAGFVADGLSLVAGPKAGSGAPTATATGHRVAVTRAGRVLTVHGRHADGVRLAWRDRAGGWRSSSTGATGSGRLLSGTGTGDWSSAIVAGDAGGGAEHAWAVLAGPNSSAQQPLRLRRLRDLDAAGGPYVGSLVTLDAPAHGAYRADVTLERRPDGTVRGLVLWSRRVAESTFELVVGSFDPRASTPAIETATVLLRGTSAARFGTLVRIPGGTLVVARGEGGALRSWAHAAGEPAGAWRQGGSGPVVPAGSAPSAVALPSGDVLVAVERDRAVTDVLRLPASGGDAVPETSIDGLSQPTVAADGGRAVVVGVAAATGWLVSRERDAGGAWSTADRVELGPEARGPVKHPNALSQADGRLRLVAEGPDGSADRSAVLAFQRPF